MPKLASELQPIYSSPTAISEATNQAMMTGISNQFPMTAGKYTLSVSNMDVQPKEFTPQDEKEATLMSKSLTYPIRGTLTLTDNETGKVVDEAKNFNLANTFHVTNKHSLMYNGNNYSVSNLVLLRPGVYTRRKDNEEVEVQFNTGKGVNFNIGLNPTTQILAIKKINKDGVNIPIAPVLRKVFGLSDAEITKYIPADVWLANVRETQGKEQQYLNRLYTKMMSVPDQRKEAPDEVKIAALRTRIEEHSLDASTTKITLGKGFENVNAEALLRAIRNLIQLHKRERPEDNRDSLEFKRVQNLPDFIGRRFDADRPSAPLKTAMRDMKRRLTMASNYAKEDGAPPPRIREVFKSRPFDKIFSDFITSSDLASTLDETNPMESLENVGKTTVIAPGEGGITSEHSASAESRNVHSSHLGIIDPSRTPESSRAGLDQRFTVTARRDKEGTMYSRVEDNKGTIQYLSANEIMTTVLGLPGQRKTKKVGDLVQAQAHGEFRNVPYESVQYWIPSATDMYTVTTNLVPFLESDHPGRITMAGKAIPQALPLVHREAPLVQTLDHNDRPFVESLGRVISTVAPISGRVIKTVGDRSLTIRGDDGEEKHIDLIDNLPFMKGFHHDDGHAFKEGDEIAAGQVLSDNNYTKDGKLALGINLHAAYLPYRGYNHEDGIVVSQRAAEKLTSSHAYRFEYELNDKTEIGLAKFKAAFPSRFQANTLRNLDSQGFVKKGSKLVSGDVVYALLERREASETDKVLGRLHKTLTSPYRAVAEVWDHEQEGIVTDVMKTNKEIKILVRLEKQLEEGDKITGFHGNKGVVSLILPNDEMPHSKETGQPVDLLLNPASVTSRINLGQIMETAAAKIAQHTGKPYLVKAFGKGNNAVDLTNELAEHGLSDVDTLYDPKTGREFGNAILAGPQYFLKLNKTTDKNYSARNIGRYDNNAQPGKGGEDGAKAVGYMEFLGLLGSDARKNLKEIGTIKSEGGNLTKSTEYWDRFMKGQMLPPVQTTFASKKFFDYLRGSGIKVTQDMEKNQLRLSPMTDTDVLAQSRGEVKDATMLHKMNPEKGGLFDFAITGGPEGKYWSHYSLAEPVVNPAFESPIKTILGLNKTEFDGLNSGKLGVVNHGSGQFSLVDNKSEDESGEVKVLRRINTGSGKGIEKKAAEADTLNTLDHDVAVGGQAIKDMMNSIDPSAEIAYLKEEIKKSSSVNKRNSMIKRLKYIYGLHSQGHEELGNATVLSHVPVLPPVMRPYTVQGNGIKYADINQMYKHHILVNNKLKQTIADNPDYLDPNSFGLDATRKDMYEGMRAIMSSGDAIEFTDKQRGVKSLMKQIAGDGSQKEGFFHKNLLSRKQDFSGRGTIYADPDLGFNEARIPKDQLWTLYKMHIMRDLAQRGLQVDEASKAYADKAPSAMQSFNKMIKEVPILLNRAPTLMRTNILAVMPVPTNGKTIGMNPLHLPAFAADYDGDALTMHAPVTPEAIREAKEKLLPSRHLNDARKGYGSPMFAPGHEAILGSVHLTQADTRQDVVTFNSEAEALEALNSGKIKDNTPIKIAGQA